MGGQNILISGEREKVTKNLSGSWSRLIPSRLIPKRKTNE